MMNYRGLTLDPFQASAIEHLNAGRSVLVCAPTGTGKTIIADWIVEQAMAQGRRVVYTAPIKALSNQKYRDYCSLFGEENVGLVTGDLVIRRDAPIRVMTTEILRNMLLSDESVDDLLAVVIDEIHFLDDPERGTVWEEVLIYLPPSVQIVGLSATLSNIDDFSAWLGEVRGAPVPVIIEEKRAVPLTIHYANVDVGVTSPAKYEQRFAKHQATARAPHDRRRGGNRNRRQKDDKKRRRFARKTRQSDVVDMLLDRQLVPALYFAFSRRSIESYARFTLRNLDLDLLSPEEYARSYKILEEWAPELGPALSRDLHRMYLQGIAFHHAGLHVQLKALVEHLYENKLIKLLYCTSTFALGINMPARAVVFDEVKKFDGRRIAPLRTREFMQMAGRAGRRGMDDTGHVLVRVDFEEYPEISANLRGYRRGHSEPVRSSFSLSWNSVVNLLESQSTRDIRQIVEKSFLNWHLTTSAERALERADQLERQAEEVARSANRQRKEARRLRKRAAKAGHRCWDEFQQRVGFLEYIGYVSADHELLAGAKVLRHIQIAEVFVTELFLDGVLEELTPPELYGVLCGVVAELPRAATRHYKLNKVERHLARHIEAIRLSEPVMEAERISGTSVSWSPYLMPLGRGWADGRTLHELLGMVSSPTDMSGDLISAFRRAKDLVGQLRSVYSADPDSADRLRALARLVTRDEVEVVD